MADSGLPDLTENPIRTIDKLYERFKMGLGDDEAERYFVELINESVSALMPQLMEKIHVWSIYWKKI